MTHRSAEIALTNKMVLAPIHRIGLRFVPVLLGGAALFGAQPLAGQSARSQFASKFKASLPELPEPTSSAVVVGDVDGDGVNDLVVATQTETAEAGQVRVLLGAAPRRSAAPSDDELFRDVSTTHAFQIRIVAHALALIDIDGDKDLDLVAGGHARHVFLNDGSGRFSDVTATRLPLASAPVRTIAAGDVDGDGDVDLVFANGELQRPGYQPALYLNDGSGTFVEATTGRLPARLLSVVRVLMFDADGDRDLDLFVATTAEGFFNTADQDRLYVNDGAGRFTDMTAAKLPVALTTLLDAAAIDIDRDGDLDVLFAQLSGLSAYLNDGSGNYVPAGATVVPAGRSASKLCVGDFDADGWSDVFCASSPLHYLLTNDRSGNLRDATTPLPDAGGLLRACFAGDVNGDGRADIVTVGENTAFHTWTRNRLYLATANGAFELTPRYELGATEIMAEAIAVGDVDGDGDVDVLIGDWNTENELLLGDGDGGFTSAPAGSIPTTRSSTRAVAFGDLDGDGDLDAYIANGRNIFTQDEVWLGDGSGRFTDVTMTHVPANNNRGYALALCDVDGDGDLDAVVGNDAQNYVYVNDGTGRFRELLGALPNGVGRTRDIVAVDIDGDQDLDLVWADLDGNAILINDGQGRFTDVTSARYPPMIPYPTGLHVTAGDVDNDGDQDLFFAAHAGRSNMLFLNDGRGFFSDGSFARLPVDRPALAAEFADIDEDGDLDIVLGSEGAAVFVNDGRGYFTDAPSRVEVDKSPTHSLAMADVDLDGDFDVILGRYMRIGFRDDNGGHRVLFNHHRDWHAPRFLQRDRDYVVDFTAEPGYGTAFAVPQLGFARLQARAKVLGFGLLALDLNGLVILPLLTTGTSGSTRVVLPVPNDASLQGLAVHTQPLVLHDLPSSSWRYGNAMVDVVR